MASWLDDLRALEGVLLSVVVPAYRSAAVLERHLPVLFAYLESLKITYEVVVCDDGSDDGGATRRITERLGCVYVANERNRGKGAAVRRGMLAARGRYRIYTDADIPLELEVIERALYYLGWKEFHVVAGDRTLPDSAYYTEQPLLRRAGSHVFASITGRLVTGGWYDTQCGLKGFRGEVADDLFRVARVDRFAADVELLYIALKRNYDIKRLAVKLRNRDDSSVRVLRDGARMVIDLFAIRFHMLRGHYTSRSAPERRGDTVPIPGDYQLEALTHGLAPQRFWHRAKLEAAEAMLAPRPGDVVLDVGCGSGVLADRLARDAAVRVIGIDPNPDAITFARKTFVKPNLHYLQGRVDDLDLADASADKIAFLEVIEHLPVEQARHVLASFRRVLRPGGRLVISTPNMRSLWPAIEWVLDHVGPTAKMAGEQHVAGYAADSLRRLVTESGFDLVDARTINGVAPWVSWLGAPLAQRVLALETRHDVGLGGLLLQMYEKRPR